MNPAPNHLKNRVLGAPPGMEADCGALEIYDDGKFLVSCWEPTDAEIEHIKNGGKVWLYIMGRMHPPVAIDVKSP
jgi:hypothetical protein